MATIEKRGSRWRVRVRKAGTDVSESFRLKSEAVAWAAQIEVDIAAGKLGRAPDHSFGDLLKRYRDEVVDRNDGARWDRLRINALVGEKNPPDPICLVRLPHLGPEHFADWRDRRLKSVSPATVRREWNLLSAICSLAVKEWRWLPENPMRSVKRPDAAPPRQRRVTDEEVHRILHACGYSAESPPETIQSRVGAMLLFALQTAMRAGEICKLKWVDVDLERRVCHVRAIEHGARKTGMARSVPLSSDAVRILKQMLPITNDRVFEVTSQSLDALFRKARNRAMIDGLHFHDSRAEALTRLSKKLDVMQLAKVSGHKDIKLLHSVYYRETAADMAFLLD